VKLGLIGFGGIGSIVAGQLATDAAIEFVGIAARPSQGERIRTTLGAVPVVETPQALLKLKPELVVECASHKAFREYAEPVLEAGIDLIAVSVGVLADAEYRERVLATAHKSGATLQIPAGAIGAIDAISAARPN